MHQFSIKIESKNTPKQRPSKLGRKKKHGNDVDFSPIKIVLSKVHQNDLDFLLIKATSKKYVEMTRKFIDIFFQNIETPSRHRGVSVGLYTSMR